MLFFLLAASAGLPVIAIPPVEIAKKLDNIIVFAPVDSSSPTSPMPLKFDLEGKSRSVYIAAFSPAAIQQVISQRLVPQKLKNAKNIKFAPYSLSKFDSLIQSELTNNPNARVLYVPDPLQVPFAEKLLIKQGLIPAKAKEVSTKIPVVFCPSPAIKATPNSGPLKGQSFVPCSTDYKSVKDLVDRGIASNADLTQDNVSVAAIPISRFTAMLAKSSQTNMIDIRVLPSPVNIKTIRNLKK
jgi:hypothetical protein